MSELKIDNPAQRLLDILEAGKTLPDAQNCRKAWIELLDAEENNEQHLLSRLAKVMELPGRILQVRRDHFSTLRGNSIHWKTCVDRAFVSQSLNSNWQSFNQHQAVIVDLISLSAGIMAECAGQIRFATACCPR